MSDRKAFSELDLPVVCYNVEGKALATAALGHRSGRDEMRLSKIWL